MKSEYSEDGTNFLMVEESNINENIELLEKQIKKQYIVAGCLFFTIVIPIIALRKAQQLKMELNELKNKQKGMKNEIRRMQE